MSSEVTGTPPPARHSTGASRSTGASAPPNQGIFATLWPTNIRANSGLQRTTHVGVEMLHSPSLLAGQGDLGLHAPCTSPQGSYTRSQPGCVTAALAPFSFPKEELLTGANPTLLRHHHGGTFLGPSQAVTGKSPKLTEGREGNNPARGDAP